MREGRPSATAEMVCSWRALEYTLPPEQRILNDPYARGFLGPTRRRLVDGVAALPGAARRSVRRQLDQALQGAVSFVLARHRAIDELILTTESDQVVFMGAGYDSRPARLCARLRRSCVFEIDHPDTARRKAELAQTVFAGSERAPTRAVTIDFTRDSVEERLREAGLATKASTIWVWEGVSMYLAESAVQDTLGLFARFSGPGSRVVCDLMSNPRRAGLVGRAARWMLGASMGWIYAEPFLWHCPRDQIASFFSDCGLAVLEDLGLDELTGRYEQRNRGWFESAPSLRLIIAEPV